MAWQTLGDHASRTWETDAVAQIPQHLVTIDAVIHRLPHGAGAIHSKGVVRIKIKTDVFCVQKRTCDQVYFIHILLAQLAIVGQQLILVTRVNARHEVKLALDEFQKGHLPVDQKADGYSIKIGQPLPFFISFEIVGIPAENQFYAFVPVLEMKWTGAHRMPAKIVAIKLHRLFGNDGSVGHRKNAEKRRKRLGKPHLKGSVVKSLKRIMAVLLGHGGKDPNARRIQALVNNPIEGIAHVCSRHTAGLRHGFILVETDVIAKVKGINGAIVADLPRLGNTRHHVHLLVKSHQTAEQLVASPDVRQVLGIDGIKRHNAARLIVFEDGKAFVRVLMFPTRSKEHESYQHKHPPLTSHLLPLTFKPNDFRPQVHQIFVVVEVVLVLLLLKRQVDHFQHVGDIMEVQTIDEVFLDIFDITLIVNG